VRAHLSTCQSLRENIAVHKEEALERHIGLVGVPSSAGAFAPGQEKAPNALREAGLLQGLTEVGIEVTDHGDGSVRRWRPDRNNRRAMNVAAVVEVIHDTSVRVSELLRLGQLAVVLGGDCTIGIGTVAGCLSEHKHIALLYFDLHPDLNVPGAVESGALDWMGAAHMLGVEGAEESVVAAGPRRPLLQPADVLFFAYGPDHLTDFESKTFQSLTLEGITCEEVAQDPVKAAHLAVEKLEERHDAFVLHFDVDVIDFLDIPLSENSGHNQGLTFETAMRALEVLLGSEHLRAVTITEYNPDHGEEDGSTARFFAQRLISAFSSAWL
jgi:arginase